MSKITFSDIQSTEDLTELNQNFTDIEQEFQNNIFYRDNPEGEPNHMEQDLDMNSNRILNLPAPINNSEAARLTDVQNALAGGHANLIPLDSGQTIEGAITIRVPSRLVMKAYDVPAGYQFMLAEGGRSGHFVVKEGTPPADTREGVYVVLANGNYAERINYSALRPQFFGAVGDNSTDDFGPLQSMFDFVEEVSSSDGTVVVDLGANRYKSSGALTIIDVPYLEIRGSAVITSTHSDEYILKISGCARANISGQLSLRGSGSTTYTTRGNMYGLIVIDCTRFNASKVDVQYTLGDGVVVTGGSSQGTMGKLEVRYCGSTGRPDATSLDPSELLSQVQTGGINSVTQRSELTLDVVPQEFKDYMDSSEGGSTKSTYVEIGDKTFYVFSYSGNTITVWPWVDTAATGSDVNWIFGGGLYALGGDTSVLQIDSLSPLVCGLGYAGYSLYPATIDAFTVQGCGIGLLVGSSTSSSASGLNINTGYFEINTFDIVLGSQAQNTFAIHNTIALDMSKVYRMWSGSSSGSPVVSSLLGASIRADRGYDYTDQRPITSTTIRMWYPFDHYLEGNTVSADIEDDAAYERVFERRRKIVYWSTDTDGMTPSGSVTFTPPAGTINGAASQEYNSATAPQAFILSRASATEWYVEALNPATITKV